jgi:hypothetical protein
VIDQLRLTAALALAAAAALGISGCGSSSQTAQARAAAYVRHVDRVEQGLTAPLRTVTAAAARLAGTSRGTPPSPAQARRQAAALRSPEARIRAAEGRLAALPAPADARPLRATLLRLLSEQVALTEQTARLVQFLPAFDRSLTPLGPATLRLERSLAVNQASGVSAVAAVYASKAGALRAFAAIVGRIARRLRALRAPEVSLPTLRAELASLGGMRTSSRALATALAAGRTTGLGTLLRRFDRAAALSGSPTVRAEQAAAIRRYDRQVEEVSQLSAQAQRERVQLATRLGTGAS